MVSKFQKTTPRNSVYILVLLIMCCLLQNVTIHAQDKDNDTILDFIDLDSDNDGIPDASENVSCTLIDLGPINGATDALTAFNNQMITVGGINGSLIQIEVPLTFIGGATIDEFIVSNDHTGGPIGMLLGVNSEDPNQSLGTFYDFSMPVCDFNFDIYDLDRDDALVVQGFLNGVEVPFTVENQGGCIVYDGANLFENDPTLTGVNGFDCDLNSSPGNMNTANHFFNITFDGCIDRLEFTIFDQGPGEGGSFTFIPTPEPTCVGLDTDLDGVPDFLDLDSDNDGIPDAIEACSDLSLVLEDCTLDSNNDGAYQGNTGVLIAVCPTAPVDTDGDDIPDFLDLDSDGDGCSDAEEACTNSNPNVNDSTVSDGYVIPANGVDECGNVVDTDGLTISCETPVSQNWTDPSISCVTCSITLVQNVQCIGEGNGSATVSPDEGNGPYTFLWSPSNETTGTATMLPAGINTVTVTDACGSTSVCDITITEPTQGVTLETSNVTDVTCGGFAEGAIDITISGGTPGYTYLWGDGDTSEDRVNLLAGSYSVLVTDANGCELLSQFTITEPEPLALEISIGCEMTFLPGCDAELMYTVIGGIGGLTVTMTDENGDPFPPNDPAGPNWSNLCDGQYDITVEDSSGCSTTESFIVCTLSCDLMVDVDTITNVTCNGFDNGIAAVMGSSSSQPITYTWEQAGVVIGTGLMMSDLAPAVYKVIAEDAIGCLEEVTFVVDEPAQLVIDNCNATPVSTVGGSDGAAEVFISGGTEPYNFNWSNSETVNPISNLAEGLYTVTVTDANDCTAEIMCQVQGIDCATFNASATITDVDCNGAANGVIDIVVLGGDGTITYEWEPNVSTSSSASNLAPGVYMVTATDEVLCSQILQATITQPSTLTAEIDKEDINCNGAANGIMDLQVSGGVEPYTFNWSNGVTLEDQSGLAPGDYSVTVTDQNNCTVSSMVTVTQPELLTCSTTLDANAICSLANGQATVTAAGGVSPYMYSWDNGETTATANTLTAGSHTVTIIDSNGCIETCTIEVLQTCNPCVEINKTSNLDLGADGVATVGDIITYTYTILNCGDVELTGANVIESATGFSGTNGLPMPSVVTPSTLQPGDTGTSTATYTLSQADVNAGGVSNEATGIANDPDGNPAEDIDEIETDIPQDPELLLIKSGVFNDEDNNGIADLGETITYTFAITNTGNVTITNITVTDMLIPNITGTITTLEPGDTDSNSITGIYSITQVDIDAGGVTNTALVQGEDPNGDPVEDPSDEVETDLPQNPQIEVIKTGLFVDENSDGFGEVGETIRYNFLVRNTGNVTVSNITITDDLVAVIGGPIILGPGEQDNTSFSAIYILTQSDIDNGSVTNQAIAAGEDPNGDPVEDPSDEIETELAKNPQFEILKSSFLTDENMDGIPQAGESLTYVFVITNTGNVTLTDISITDDMVSLIGGPIAVLEVGEVDETSYTGTYILTQDDVDAGEVINIALGVGEDPDGEGVTEISDDPNNPADIDTENDGEPDDPTVTDVLQVPKFVSTKTGTFNDENGDRFADAGETITYTFTVTNVGNVTIFDVIILDELVEDIVGGPITSLAPNETDTNTFTGTYVLAPEDLITLNIVNQALVIGEDPNGDPAEDLSDDPNNPDDTDTDDDGDPDDPTSTFICGVSIGGITAGEDFCFEAGQQFVISGTPDNNNIVPTGYELRYVLTSDPGFVIEQVSTTPSFIVGTPNKYLIHTLIAELTDPTDPNFVDLNNIALGETTATELIDLFIQDDICADINTDGAEVIISVCDITLNMEQTDVLQLDNDDISLTFDLTVTNNTLFDVLNFSLQDTFPFFPIANPASPINVNNVVVELVNINATTLPNVNPLFNGTANNAEILDGNSGFLQPNESFIIRLTTEVSLDAFRELAIQENSAFIDAISVDQSGEFLSDVSDISDDRSIIDDFDFDNDGDPDDPTPIDLMICDELICNNDLIISLGTSCELLITPDIVLERPALFGDYEIEFFDDKGNSLGDVLTPSAKGVLLTFETSCGFGSCWGNAVVETNKVPQFNAPCECNEDGVIPDDCIFWCSEDQNGFDGLITEQDVKDSFATGCGPDLLNLTTERTVSGDLCSDEGETITITYEATISRHDRIEKVEVLCQTLKVHKIDLDVPDAEFDSNFGYPDKIILDCNYLDEINTEEEQFELASPESIYELTGNIGFAYPYVRNMHRLVADTSFVYDTIQIFDEANPFERDSMVQQDVNGDGELEWVQIRIVDKPLIDTILIDTIVGQEVNPKMPLTGRFCNILSSYTDIVFDACGEGEKIIRNWTIVDWCDARISKSGRQVIEVKDYLSPKVLVTKNGEKVPVTMLDDVVISTDPWTCSASFKIPELEIYDNCDVDPNIEWLTEEGIVQEDYIIDLWKTQSPVKVTARIYDSCKNSSDVGFNIVILDQIAPVPVCETALQVGLTKDNSGDFGIAKIFAEDLDEGSHDSGCGKITLSVVRKEDWTKAIRGCNDLIVGYEPVSCYPLIDSTDLLTQVKEGCEDLGEYPVAITKPGDHVNFCCEDLGQIVEVLLIVTDKQGNTNYCTVFVEVVDESIPGFKCQDEVLTCYDAPMHAPVIEGGCPMEHMYEVLLLNESIGEQACAGGQSVREWYIDADNSGDFSSGDAYCMQVIFIEESSLFDPHSIKWPKHYDGAILTGVNLECETNDDEEIVLQEKSEHQIAMGDVSTCIPDNIDDEPVWCSNTCGLIGYSATTDTIVASDACLKIIKRWTIVDWCTYVPNSTNTDDENDSQTDQLQAVEDWAQGDCYSCPLYETSLADPVYFRYSEVEVDGYYTFDQIIKVVDDTAPTIDSPEEYIVNTAEGAETKDDEPVCSGSEMITANASDLCNGELSSSELLKWQITVTKNGEIVAEKSAQGPQASMNSQEGSDGDEHEIIWKVSDGCGNQTQSTTKVIFKDNQAPTPFCLTSLTSTFDVGQESLIIWANEFDFGSFDNCTATEDLRFSIITVGDTSLTPSQEGFEDLSSITIDCDNLTSLYAFEVWVWDNDGNGDNCNVALQVTNYNEVCGDQGGANQGGSNGALISGQITNPVDLPLADVTITLQTSELEKEAQLSSSNEEGKYEFNNNLLDYNYTLAASKLDDFVTGLTTLDLVVMSQYLIGTREMSSPYYMIAADANGDSKVSAADIVSLKNLVVGNTEELLNMSAWVFMDKNQQFFDIQNPWPFTEIIDLSSLSSDMINQNFVGVKLGDVTGDVNGLKKSELRQGKGIEISINDEYISKGQLVEVTINAADFADVYGMQFTLIHDNLDFISAKGSALQLTSNDIGLHDSKLAISWHSARGKSLLEGEDLMHITFKATDDIRLSEVLNLNSEITKAESYTSEDLVIGDVKLSFERLNSNNQLFQNTPNPFEESTKIGFSLSQVQKSTLTIFDVTGKELFRIENSFEVGYNEVQINKADIGMSGVLYYRLDSGEFSATRKMIIL